MKHGFVSCVYFAQVTDCMLIILLSFKLLQIWVT